MFGLCFASFSGWLLARIVFFGLLALIGVCEVKMIFTLELVDSRQLSLYIRWLGGWYFSHLHERPQLF